MIYAIYAFLVVVAFLSVLNGFLHGAKKAKLDAVLGLLLVGLIAASFVVAGWKFGLLAVAVAFVGGMLTRPLAVRLAFRLLSGTTGGTHGSYIGIPPKSLARISKELGRQLDPGELLDEMVSGSDRRGRAINDLLDYCEGQSEIQEIMTKYKLTRNQLKELYSNLVASGAGQWVCCHWVAASSIAYPEALQYLINRKDADRMETVYHLFIYFERGLALVPSDQTIDKSGKQADALEK